MEREAWLMGTTLRVRLAAATRAGAVERTELVFAEVERLEAVLSTWREDAELARLGKAPPGEPVEIGRELAGLLLEAKALARTTGGAFDPGVGPLVDAWDLRGAGRRPDAVELRRALEASGIGRFEVTPGGTAVRPPGGWIDSGAFGKGAALRSAAALLRGSGVTRALLDFGGQVVAIGAPAAAGAGGWEVAVAHPSHRDEPAALLRLRDVGAATTGASERFVEVDGERLGHVLDPRTGLPVPAWGTVTVVADDPLLADALATALFVMGPEEGGAWAARHDSLAGALFLVETADGPRAEWSPRMEAYRVDAPQAAAGRAKSPQRVASP